MKISIITVFPEIHETFLKTSIIRRAIEKNIVSINLVRFSDFCAPKERIDEPVVGPGAGMIIKPEVVAQAIESCQTRWGIGKKIFFSPQGTKLTQQVLKKLANQYVPSTIQTETISPSTEQSEIHLILVCSRYEGMDARVESLYADHVLSIGDYVVMGGDIPAQVFLEGFLRLIPGVVGTWESVTHESFSGSFLDYPEYGLPVVWERQRIPEIVQSGNHAAIQNWRLNEACKKTIIHRFDWFSASGPTKDDIRRAQQYIPAHYVALMHTQVKLKDGTIGTTSITSIDLHDTARSCATYGVKNFFMVSPLADQQAIMATFLDFWQSDEGKRYNSSRHHAVSKVQPTYTLEQTIEKITLQEGTKPLVIATSAKSYLHQQIIDYKSQGKVWAINRPVLFLFGTGQGLDDSVIEKCDFLLLPIEGMTDFNHLSVRSAIAIILDRWLGLHPTLDK